MDWWRDEDSDVLCIETVSDSGRRKNRMRWKVGFRENVWGLRQMKNGEDKHGVSLGLWMSSLGAMKTQRVWCERGDGSVHKDVPWSRASRRMSELREQLENEWEPEWYSVWTGLVTHWWSVDFNVIHGTVMIIQWAEIKCCCLEPATECESFYVSKSVPNGVSTCREYTVR